MMFREDIKEILNKEAKVVAEYLEKALNI